MNSSAELLAPAGDFETALSAFAAGADAVYCGLSDFSARAFAKNLSFDELEQLLRYARAKSRKVYITFNTLLDEEQLDGAIEKLAKLEALGPDAIIVQDLGVARLASKYFPKLELHASTQLVAHNLEGVLALKELGFRRIVLARELSLEEISRIARSCGSKTIAADGRAETELEVFIHGALCYSLSGLCLYGAMEKGRSGNRGKCPYCCRQEFKSYYPFSMKDLRLGEDVRKLVDAGVASLKIEGRMKSALYVSSVTKYYRDILDGEGAVRDGTRTLPTGDSVTDLETVFSRRTTELYLNGRDDSAEVIDPESLGHRGTPIGRVKKITKDREGLSWLRFHTERALEKHDGLQFDALTDEGRHFGFGITEMRQTISRRNVFEVSAGEDVEILLPEVRDGTRTLPIHSGDTVYCSMSNAVKRRFPIPAFRPSDYPGTHELSLKVTLSSDKISAEVLGGDFGGLVVTVAASLSPAKSPEKTFAAVEKAFSKLGGSAYCLGKLIVEDPDRLFAPASVMNDLRRDLVEKLDAERERALAEKIESVRESAVRVGTRTLPHDARDAVPSASAVDAKRVLKVCAGQKVPSGEWDEIVVSVGVEGGAHGVHALPQDGRDAVSSASAAIRLALPVYTSEIEFNKLRNLVKRYIREGYAKWEASDLATLRMLRALGIEDITADWSLYAMNSQALAALTELGVKRFVASPENNRENLQYLAESGLAVEFLEQQSTPLFISLHRPSGESGEDIVTFEKDGLFVTTKTAPRTFSVPDGVPRRIDLSWDSNEYPWLFSQNGGHDRDALGI